MFEYHKKESPIISLLGMGGGIGSYIFTAADTGYEIARSLRFNSADAAYLSRTPSTAGNRKTWTFSTWAKLTGPYDGTDDYLLIAYGSGSAQLDYFDLRWQSNIGVLRVGGYSSAWRTTTAVFRDPSAWYHIVLVWDTTQATPGNRVRLYVNGVEQTDFDYSSDPNPDDVTSVNNNVLHRIGVTSNVLLADCQLIDGSALEPTEFGTFDTYGVWQPKRYTGSKSGVNTFHLPFSDTISATTLGYDDSGNNNNWTANNISVVTGSGFYARDLSVSSGSITTPVNAFNGILSNAATATVAAATITFTPSSSISYSSLVEVLPRLADSNTSLNGGSTVFCAANGWTTIASGSGTITSISFATTGPSDFMGVGAIRVDGSILIDYLAESANDSLLDSPSNADTTTTEDTGVGGELAGNYCTWNPLDTGNMTALIGTLSEGNLKFTSSGGTLHYSGFLSTLGLRSGKWYCEFSINAVVLQVGIVKETSKFSAASSTYGFASPADVRLRANIGSIYYSANAQVTGLATFSSGQLLMIAVDFGAGKMWTGVDGTWDLSGNPSTGANPTTTFTTGDTDWLFAIQGFGSAGADANFGQRAFAYSAPTGFKALNTANLPTPTIEDGSQYVGVATYTGTGSNITVPLNFEPDFTWTKCRTATSGHVLQNVVSGITTKYLQSQVTDQEYDGSGGVQSTSSTGFVQGTGSGVNTPSETYVTWAWDAGSNSNKTYTVTVPGGIGGGFYIDGDQKPTINLEEGSTYTFDQSDSSNSGHPFKFSETSDGTHGAGTEYTTNVTTFGTPGSAGAYTRIEVAASAPTLYYYCSNHSAMGGQINTNSTAGASNFDGSIPSVVRANPSAGFSIVTASPSGTADTYGHGLGVTPSLIISKRKDGTGAWYVRTSFLANPGSHYLILNSTAAVATDTSAWANTAANSSVITFNASYLYGGSVDLVNFCFAPIEGYSAFGSYTGNGSDTDGPFVYTGFRPRWILIKSSSTNDSGYGDWVILDSNRDSYNAAISRLWASLPDGESVNPNYSTDFLSNGFKIKTVSSGHIGVNSSGVTYIYAAFAENPFRSARAR